MFKSRCQQEDLEIGANLLYDIVETAHLNGNVIPSRMDLMKCVKLNIPEFGYKRAMNCVLEMEHTYRQNLKEAKYLFF